MTEADASDALRRRHLLTRGAALAGTAAGAVALGVAGARPAAAANGDGVTVGTVSSGTSRTGLTVNKVGEPALQLTNNQGPALKVVGGSGEFTGTLAPGEVAGDPGGLVLGVADADGNTYQGLAAILDDLDALSLPFTVPPTRLVDTRSASGRANILDTSGLDSSGKLKAGKYIDVVVDSATEGYTVDAVFLNLTSTGSTANGYLSAYPPGDRPNVSTLSYSKAVTIANFALASTGIVGSSFVVRIYSSALTHVIIDQTGALVTFVPPASAARTTQRSSRRKMAARRPRTYTAKRR